MQGLAYLVGGVPADVRRAASTSARAARAPEPEHADAPVVAQPAEERAHGRRQRSKTEQFGRRYEYLDAEPTASARGAEALGFAGTAPAKSATPPAGLTALADDAFGGGTRAPMLPSTWDAEP
ncbi:hypothetical protein A5675_24290 [Mycobacterium malmoense]|uniref:PPW family C-terminal domain-containing PPE protein n=1 Tax=Mycobacterium malmoense TaxID=1780 RepID=UPI00080B15C9|nr:hypothetical protein [Mycobacterium malmoense]OCB32472.1 hypothetical protein A5675_24290 [Mycobacterium malmoense]